MTRRNAALAALILLLSLVLIGCPNRSATLTPESPTYKEAVSAFFTGTVSLQTSDNPHAEEGLKKATALMPGEPAAWANWAVYQMRKPDLAAAAESLKKAHDLAPDNADIAILEGVLARQQGKFDEAMADFQRAAKADPKNLKAHWLIAEVADQLRNPDAEKVKQESYQRILEAHPNNTAVLIEYARSLAASGDSPKLAEVVKTLSAQSAGWPEQANSVLAEVRKSAAGDPRQAALRLVQLRNVLVRAPSYRTSVAEVSTPQTGDPIARLIKTPNPPPQPAVPDTALKYAPEAIPGTDKASLVLATPLDDKNPPAVLVAAVGSVLRADKPGIAPLKLPTGAAKTPTSQPVHLTALDIYGDFQGGIAAAGPGGLRLFRQKAGGGFEDVTAKAKLPAAVTNAPYAGVWAVDIEADGDLDLILSPANGGAPVVLQNNGDGTFALIKSPFPEVASPVRGFAWADIDGDGDPDPVFADAMGKLFVYANERSGRFRLRPVPPGVGTVRAIAAAEVTGDTNLDIVALQDDGALVAVADKDDGTDWQPVAPLAKSGITDGAQLFAADLDNNGGIDLIAASAEKSEVFLSDAQGKFTSAGIPVALGVQSVADLNGDGLLDLAGIAGGKPSRALASGVKKYNYQNFTLRAQKHAQEDKRINTFCIGGEVELRAGLLYQKQPITTPQTHFGLGENPQADVVRITWPNGDPQSEINVKANTTIVAEQRLGGSCPFLFAWDGKRMVFITDCIWRSPLGLRINAQATAGTSQTEDWVKVRGDQLAPKDGFYDLSITAELRETHFFDHLALLVVDHPWDTDVFVDERFNPTAPPFLKVIPTKTAHPVSQALGANGEDVTDIVRDRDGRYLDDFGRGQYQGVTRDHHVEVVLGDEVPRSKPIYLIAFGWLHPTDSSINVALGQNRSAAPPSGLAIETPDAKGRWSIARQGLGFPAGKVKTIVLRVDDTFKPGASRRLRLRTNLEIFWDQLSWAEALPQAPLKTQRLAVASADLRYRGFSDVRAKDASSPELPQSYDLLAGAAPRWRDLIGYHTRFGDVKPLVEKVDDRYVIMNAGDEMRLRFPAPAPPPTGWRRDFVLIGDGWEKDGNVNTAFGKTVLPLPLHDRKSYDTPPGRLEDDPAYRRHPEDWQTYHTRYVTPDAFRQAMKQ